MANESVQVADFIHSRLAADPTISSLVGARIVYDFAGASPTYPYVMILYLSGEDRNAIGADQRVFNRPLFLVEAQTMDSNWLVADQLSTRIDLALMGAAGVHGGRTILGMFREREARRVEVTPQAQAVRHLGGEYRSFVT